MAVVKGYTESLLAPQLRSLGLSKQQREIVVDDVTRRLDSLLSHWDDAQFRRTILDLAAEEAFFWEPRSASLETRSLVLLGVRNSLIEDLGTPRPSVAALQTGRELLPDDRMPWITSEAVKYFDSANTHDVRAQPGRDLFGELPRRFPNAWHVLSLLGNSPGREIECTFSMMQPGPVDSAAARRQVERHTVVSSGIDPRLDDQLVQVLGQIKAGDLDLFFSPSFKTITRNPEKLLHIIDSVLRYGGTVLTSNYLLSPTYLARRDPLLRPIHYNSELEAQLNDLTGLTDRHRNVLAAALRLCTALHGKTERPHVWPVTRSGTVSAHPA